MKPGGLRIGLPVIGGPRWMAGVTYVEMLARSVHSVAGGHELYLVATPASLPDVESHLRLLPLFRGVILLLGPGADPAPFQAGALVVCRDRAELFARIDFLFPVLNDAWKECSASWIPDFQHRFLPDFFPERERADRDAAFAGVAERARMLVLSSAAVEADFRKFYPDSRAVTRVLSFFAFADEAVFRGDPGGVRVRYGLPERYLLCCNQFWMHKDHGTLFSAAARLRKAGMTVPIVCTGSTTDYRSAGYFDRVQAEIASLGIGDQVRILGMIPRDDQLQLIRAACALVQPSLFEGWSSIVEDARSLAKPIFLTDIAVHKEQDPPDGTFFRAGDPGSLAAVLRAGFPSLPAGPDAAKERQAREAAALRMRAFGRDFLGIAQEARALFATAGTARSFPPVPGSRPGGDGPRPGINLIGYPSSNLGLGAAARNTLALLQERKVPVAVFDLDAGGGRSLHETYFREICVATADRLPHGINLWHLNPPELVHLMNNSVPKFAWDRFNACVPFWELPVLPDAWLPTLEAMDVVLAPTRFIEANLAAALPSARVRYFRQPLRMPEPPRLGRETWGIPPGEVVFLTSFDCGSDVLRKNPSAAVAAFREAFRDRKGVRLIVKWVNEGLDEASRKAAARLRGEIGGHPGISILDRNMAYPEVMALYRAADAFISLHRAEGLGLGLMESMALGKPVIGTAWSGNMDFMTEANSCLVGYGLVPVPADGVYARMLAGKPARWAEPDPAEAAAWMRRLAEDAGLRRSLGARAEEDIREYNRVARLGDVFDDIEAMRRNDAAGPPRTQKAFNIPPPPVPVPSDAPAAAEPARRGPKVTAIVSTYGAERFIRGCLQNLVEQTLFREGLLEVVVIDSGSPEGEGAVAAEFKARHPGFVYVRTERETLYSAWNRAVKLARGAYLVNANTDDRHRPDAFRLMAETLDANPEGLVYADAILTRRENETWSQHSGRTVWACPDYNLRQALVDCPFGCVVMWRRKLHETIGFFDPAFKVAGDYEFFLRAAMAEGARHIRETLCLYYQSEDNLSFRCQVDVDQEINGFMRAYRRNTPLEAVYPFLAAGSSPRDRACAALDLATAFLNAASRGAPEEAEYFLLQAREIEGDTPEVLYNLSLAYFDQGRKEDARRCLTDLFRLHPDIAEAIDREKQADPERRAMFTRSHPAIDGMPKILTIRELRFPVEEYAAGNAGREAGEAGGNRKGAEKGGTLMERREMDGKAGGRPGMNLIGFVSSNIGLGAAARNTLELLVETGHPVSVFDLDAGLRRSHHESLLRERWVSSPQELPHGINLWHVNPPEVYTSLNTLAGKFDWNRFNICVPFWELEVLPDSWIRPLQAMDLILAPTRFIERTLAAHIDPSKIRYFRQPLKRPEIPGLGRDAFGIPADDLVFLTSFDFGSDLLRKNPIGTVVAFLNQFRDRPGVRLVLKWVNQDADERTLAASAAVKEQVSKHANIQIIDRSLPYPEVLALYRAADVFVSLHRAEGLGLGLMESMSLGKPVIGTAWSGNMDFMSAENSCPIGYRLVAIPESSDYSRRLDGKPAQWAEPDLEEAGRWMSRLAGDPDMRRRLGARAAADIREYNRVAYQSVPFEGIEVLAQAKRNGAVPRATAVPSAGTVPPAVAPPRADTGFGIRKPPSAPETGAPPAEPPVGTAGDGSKRLRPDNRPDGAYSLQLRRLAGLGLLSPKPGGSRGKSLVTAVVSAYNSEIFIRGCLQNLVEQTLHAQGRLEIVVVDSGSPQGEGAVVAEFRARHPGIVYLRTERETLYAAWNRAVKASKGTYLVNANTDDRHRPEAFEIMADALDASYAGLAYGDAILTSGENETWSKHTATQSWSLPDFNIRQALVDCPFGCVVMWRKSLHDEVGYFNPAYKIAGDYDFFLRSSILRGAIHLKEPLALYYESQKNLSYGNQDLVNQEVDDFLRPLRRDLPLETIYPFLRVENSKLARLAAAMDFAALMVHPLARQGRVEALSRLLEAMKEVGLVPELANNMALIMMALGQKEDAKGLMRRVLSENPGVAWSLSLGSPEGDWAPTRLFRIEHQGLQGLPDTVFSAHTRSPLPGKEGSRWTAGRRAVP